MHLHPTEIHPLGRVVQWGEAVGGVEVAAADRGSGGSGRAVRGINDVTERRICSLASFIRKEKEGAVQRRSKERVALTFSLPRDE